ncbi:unnamed protein product [Urochloa humidicola]
MQGPRKAMQKLMRRMQPWMDAWDQATEDRVYEQAPYDPTSYLVYLQWYAQRTRTRLVSIRQRPEEATVPHALLYPGHAGWSLHEAADMGMEMERDAGQAVALLRSRDSSGALDDVIEMFSHLGQKAKRLVQIAMCRHTDDSIGGRREPPSRERPPRPPP